MHGGCDRLRGVLLWRMAAVWIWLPKTSLLVRSIQTIASTRLDHGGTSRSVPAICNAMVEMGCDNHLITATPYDEHIPCNFPHDRSRVHAARESGRLRQYGVGAHFARQLRLLTSESTSACIVHDHAIWLATNHAVAGFCRDYRIPRVVSPRGMLGTWALKNGSFKKRIAWRLYQGRDLRSATAFHATSEQEAKEIRSLGFIQPIAVIPNGVDVPETLPAANLSQKRRALFLSRIHPKKGLVSLVRAWKSARVDASWQLIIAGPDERGHRSDVEKEVNRLGLANQVTFLGPVNDEHKWQLYVDSNLFVLPSHNENFGIVIAEAMATGRPVLTTTGTPWKAIEDRGLGWWVPASEGNLAQALADATTTTQLTLDEMGARARRYIGDNFSWQASAEHMLEFYTWLLYGGASPACLYKDSKRAVGDTAK